MDATGWALYVVLSMTHDPILLQDQMPSYEQCRMVAEETAKQTKAFGGDSGLTHRAIAWCVPRYRVKR
jgi:hypothetical protein